MYPATHISPAILRKFDTALILPLQDLRCFDVPIEVINPDDPPVPLKNPVAIAIATKLGYKRGAEYERCSDDPLLRMHIFEDGCRVVCNMRRCDSLVHLECMQVWAKGQYRKLLPMLTLQAIPWYTLFTIDVPLDGDPFALRERLRRHLPKVTSFVRIAYDSSGYLQVRIFFCGTLTKSQERTLLLRFAGKLRLDVLSKDNVSDLLKRFLAVDVPRSPQAAADLAYRMANRVLWSQWSKPQVCRDNPLTEQTTQRGLSRHNSRAPMTCCHGKKCIATTHVMRASDISSMAGQLPFILERSTVRRN